MTGRVVVFDVGKTLAKLSIWEADGRLVERRTRPNERREVDGCRVLDAAGIEAWAGETLREFARLGNIDAIVPVGHGAAAAVVRGGRLVCPVPDYEDVPPAALRAQYDAERDPFAKTGSPALPAGLNLGVQLSWLEQRVPNLFAKGSMILPWPQYWAWVLSGIAASEVTSLGCHTDLWRPLEQAPSQLAIRRGWAHHLPPLHKASDTLGTLLPDWAKRTGLSPQVRVICGVHDSNAALVAARSFAEVHQRTATVLSTGTWFIAMRTGADSRPALEEARDCLINVDVHGQPVPSARFMGGREIELALGTDQQVDREHQPELVQALARVVQAQAMILPSFVSGSGPYPRSVARWLRMPDDAMERRASAGLYAALVADTSLRLVDTRERLVIEGRFARSEVFSRSLATLRPDLEVYVSNADNDCSYGALRLVLPSLEPPAQLSRVEPLPLDLLAYQKRWQREIDAMEAAA